MCANTHKRELNGPILWMDDMCVTCLEGGVAETAKNLILWHFLHSALDSYFEVLPMRELVFRTNYEHNIDRYIK